jgi:hypothetical protein
VWANENGDASGLRLPILVDYDYEHEQEKQRLFVAQRFDRIEVGGAVGGVQTEADADG